MNRAFWINQGLFQAAWPACVVGAAFGLLWPGILVVAAMAAWQLQADRRHPSDLKLAGLFVLAGLVLDTLWVQAGILAYATAWPVAGVAPLWIVLLWAAMGLAANHSMAVFQQRPAWLFVLASVGSPLSYLAGARFGAVEWLAPAWQVVLLLGPVWALAVTGLFLAARRMGRQHALGRAVLASRSG